MSNLFYEIKRCHQNRIGESSASGMIGMEGVKEVLDSSQNESITVDINQENVGDTSKVDDIVPNNAAETNQIQSVAKDGNCLRRKNVKSCGFQMEKPKLPKFSGVVREYAIFRDDFKHAIESR